MITIRHEELKEPAVVKRPGFRASDLPWVVVGYRQKVLAAFPSEQPARAYAHRLNQLHGVKA